MHHIKYISEGEEHTLNFDDFPSAMSAAGARAISLHTTVTVHAPNGGFLCKVTWEV